MQRYLSLMLEGPDDFQRFIIYSASRNPEHPDAWPGQFGLAIKAANAHLSRAAMGRVRAALNTICAATHTQYKLELVGSMPDMRNDKDLVQNALLDMKTAFSSDLVRVRSAFPFNCEDFTFYTRSVPGAMIWLGAANPAQGKYAMLHTPNFDVDEDCLVTGARAMTTLLLSTLSEANSD
jgi:metal-dependent amidase/aminoacylase/carboxypeptidase family protein